MQPRPTKLVLVLIVVFVGVLAPPSIATADLRSQSVSALPDPGASSSRPALALDEAGTANLAWVATASGNPPGYGFADVRFVRLQPDGTFGPTAVLTEDPVPGFDPAIVVDAAGDARVVWKDDEGIESATVSAAGAVSGETLLAPDPEGGFGPPRIAADRGGRATIVWRDFVRTGEGSGRQERIQALSLDAGGRPGPVRTLSGEGFAFGYQVGVDRRGGATVLWQRRPSAQTPAQVEAVRLSPGGKPGPVRRISPRGSQTRDPELAIEPSGRTTIAWEQRRRRTDVLREAQLDRHGVPGPTRTLATGGFDFSPGLIADARGRVSIGWKRRGVIELVRIDADGLPGKVRKIDGDRTRPAARPSFGPELAVDSRDRVVVVWPQCCGLRLVRIGASGVPGRRMQVPGAGGKIDDVAIAVDARDRPVIAWSGQQGVRLIRGGEVR